MIRVHELGVGEDGRLRELDSPAAEASESVRVLHIEGSLFFGAAGELRDALNAVARAPGVKALVVRLKRTRGLDVTTAQVIGSLARQLEAQGCHLVLVGLRPRAMRVLENTGIAAQIGPDNLFPTRRDWFHATHSGEARALELTQAPASSPLRRYVQLRLAELASTSSAD